MKQDRTATEVPCGTPVDRHVRPAAWASAGSLAALARLSECGRTQTWLRNTPEEDDVALYDKTALDAAVAVWRKRIDGLLREHQGVSLDTLEYLETMRQGPTAEGWAELDRSAKA